MYLTVYTCKGMVYGDSNYAISKFISARLCSTADNGVADMTAISDIDENGINHNLKVRYKRDQIYVSFSKLQLLVYIYLN